MKIESRRLLYKQHHKTTSPHSNMATLAEDDRSDDSEDDDDDETDGFAALQSAWISNDELDDCMGRARDASTTKGYKSAVKKFLAFCVLFMATQQVCSDVLKLNDDDSSDYEFDVPKLAKSMESVHGPYISVHTSVPTAASARER